MLTKYLFDHQWKSFSRNESWSSNILNNIFYGILILYILLVFISFDIFIEDFIVKVGRKPVDLINSVLLWYLFCDLLCRCYLQQLPAVQFIPYLRFNIGRKELIYFLLFRSYLNLFNIIPWLIVIPISLKIIIPNYGLMSATIYLVGILMLLTLNNYLSIYLHLQFQKRFIYILIPIGLLICVSAFAINDIQINDLSISFGQALLNGNPIVIGILISLNILVLVVIVRYLLQNFYIDEVSKKEVKAAPGKIDISFFNNTKAVSQYLWLEFSLLTRNNRSKRTLVLLPSVMIYFSYLELQSNTAISKFMTLLFMSCSIPIAAATYGQFLFSWESAYFDGIISRKNHFRNYVKAKYFLMIILVSAVFIPLFFGFVIYRREDLTLLFSIYLFTLGVMCFIILLFGTYNNRRIDISHNNWFKYQGAKGIHIILSFTIMLIPACVYLLFNYIISETAAKLSLTISGLLFLISHNWWIAHIIVPNFMARKYKNMEGYRKLST
jgi:Family of unknown function (DUF5687)